MNDDRVRLLDSDISILEAEGLKDRVLRAVNNRYGGYVCFANVHTVVDSRTNADLRCAINGSLAAAPDGRPLSVVAKWRGVAGITQVAGPDFFTYLMEEAPHLSHFFLGGTEQTLAKLLEKLNERYPDLRLAGHYSPPFAPMEGAVNAEIIERIDRVRPDIVWVGLGAPKQEIWMSRNWHQLQPSILMGVGAAFDFHAGTVRRASPVMRRLGLEWLHRLASEPRRLWKRYLVTNCVFMWEMMKSLLVVRV
ncbi:WecB/TagA/CpsF family glycosyltransferase [Haliea sp. E17]|uniref:WecB/TagA/CpsF family glycosyltransferase n=1 Tax=Haliea sp. E17 TaxID=3401576 RepID=UPI003AAC0E19